MKKFVSYVMFLVVILAFVAVPSGSEALDIKNLGIKNGKIYNGSVRLLDYAVNELSSNGPIRNWCMIGIDGEFGVVFFSAKSNCVGFLPMKDKDDLQDLMFSPKGGNFVIVRGGITTSNLFMDIYSNKIEKIAELPVFRDGVLWIDDARFVFTRIDGIREGGGFLYGLRSSVSTYDTKTEKESVVKESTDTQNFGLLEIAGGKATIVEEYVANEKDWSNEKKVKEREIKIDLSASVQKKEKYRTCFNDRFGYSVEFPDIFHTSREPDNGDGIEFKSRDGKYSLAIWGSYNVLEDDGHSALKRVLENISNIAPGYPKSGDDFYAIEYGKDRVFYQYGIVNPDLKAGFLLSYPKSEEARFSDIKRRMAETLKLP